MIAPTPVYVFLNGLLVLLFVLLLMVPISA